MTAIVLAATLTAYNNLANRWGPFNRWLYVPANLSATTLLLALALAPLGLSLRELGLAPFAPVDLAVGLGLGAALALPLFVAAHFPRTASVVADRRVSHLRGRALLWRVLVRVPLGTALFEEVAFRGVLYAQGLQEWDRLAAALLSSAAFGLWHIAPTLNALEANYASRRGARLAGTIVAMAAAGLLLVWLRVESEGIYVPLGLHAALNSLATIAAVRAALSSATEPNVAHPLDPGHSPR